MWDEGTVERIALVLWGVQFRNKSLVKDAWLGSHPLGREPYLRQARAILSALVEDRL